LRAIAPLLFLLALVALPRPAASDTSPPRTAPPREWKDAEGRVIKRLDASGRLTLLWWDEHSRLVKVAGMAHLFSAREAEGALDGPEAWVHCFEYGSADAAEPTVEFDCVGERHAVPGACRDLERRTTSLKDHRHVRESGHAGRPAGREGR